MEQLSGTMIKGYELRDRIGAGGFGAVYRAFQSTVGREVAIKIILPGFANRPDFVRRFEAEAQTIARLEHMNITPLYDYWRDPEGAYLVMRYLRGGSLLTALRDDPYDLESAARLLDQVASALAVAHRNHIIHRDIKPANILLDEDGNGYVADFGLAKDIDNGAVAHTQRGDVVGTPDYLSPEQVRNEPVTPRSDIYSLGLVLYEMLTGSHPFPESMPVERMFKQLNEPVPRIASLDQNVAEAINEVIQKATAKNPDQRYKEVLALATAFREAAGLSVSRAAEKLVELLTPREQEVLRLIIAGKSNREIGDKLTIELTTVKWYVTQIYRKLNVRSRVQAIVRARELDLIVDGRAADALTASQISTLPEPENPYKGLQAFQIADEHDFFGRENLTHRLLTRLGQADELARFLAVIGPSGSGKSSLVRAGLIPALWRGDLPGSERWYITDLIPGAHPLDELEVALIQVAANRPENLREQLARDERGLVRAAQIILPDDDSELVIVIDQFEEVFTLVEQETDRIHFLGLLHQAVTEPRSRVRLVITLRADFYDRPLQYPAFGELVRSRMETVLPLSAGELEQAIIGPAQRVRVRFAKGLVAAIVSDINYQPGALPLLQFALTELFEAREDHILTQQGYEQIGRAVGALAKRAEQLFLELAEAGRESVRQMFLRLVTLGDGSDDTRRRVARSELLAVAQNADVMDEVIDTYATYRLLALDHDPASRSPTVEVAHEALIYAWERFRQWLDESRADIRLQRLLAAAATEWLRADREPGFLLHGSRLDQFEGWGATTDLALTEKERLYLGASLEARQKQEANEAARLQRELETAQKLAEAEHLRAEEQSQTATKLHQRAIFLGAALLIAGVLAVVAVIFGRQASQNEQEALAQQASAVAEAEQRATAQAITEQQREIAEQQRQEAEDQANLAASRELAAAALLNLDEDPERSILLAMQALLRIHTVEGEEALHKAVQTSRVRQTLPAPENFPSNWLSYSPDGRRIFTSGLNGGVMWDAVTSKIVYTRTVPNIYNYAPDYVTEAWINRADFSPDGVLLVQPNEEWAGDEPLTGTITLLAADTGEELLTFPAHSGGIQDVTFNPEGTQFASTSFDGTTKVWNVVATLATGTGQEVATLCCHNDWVLSVAFSPDGKRLVTTSNDKAVKMWDAVTGDELFSLDIPGTDAVFSPDGQYVIVGTLDGAIHIIESERGDTHAITPGAHGQNLVMVVFSPDGNRLATTSPDGIAKVWDYSNGEVEPDPLVLSGHEGWVAGVSFTPDSDYVATGGGDRVVRIWDVSTDGGSEYGLYAHNGRVWEVAFSPNGDWLASVSSDGTATVWDIAARELLFSLTGHEGRVIGLAIAPDGDTLATVGDDGVARIWDAQTGKELLLIPAHQVQEGGNRRGANGVVFSPDGKRLVTGGGDKTVRVWDIVTGNELFNMAGHTDEIYAVVYSPDGRYIASTGGDETIRVWNAIDGRELWILSGDPSTIWNMAVSHDSSRLVVGHNSGYVIVWQLPGPEADTEAEPEIALQFQQNSGWVAGVHFSPDDNILSVSGLNRTSLHYAQTGESILEFAHPSGAADAVISPDGRIVATAGNDGFVRLFAANLEELTTLAQSRLTRSLTEDECRQYLHLEECPVGE